MRKKTTFTFVLSLLAYNLGAINFEGGFVTSEFDASYNEFIETTNKDRKLYQNSERRMVSDIQPFPKKQDDLRSKALIILTTLYNVKRNTDKQRHIRKRRIADMENKKYVNMRLSDTLTILNNVSIPESIFFINEDRTRNTSLRNSNLHPTGLSQMPCQQISNIIRYRPTDLRCYKIMSLKL